MQRVCQSGDRWLGAAQPGAARPTGARRYGPIADIECKKREMLIAERVINDECCCRCLGRPRRSPGKARRRRRPRRSRLANEPIPFYERARSTIRFGPAGAVVRWHWTRDVNRDGVADLVVTFKTRHTGIKCGDTAAPLTARTFRRYRRRRDRVVAHQAW